jgi:isopropylmalate/homocitrate/citramalate synthase
MQKIHLVEVGPRDGLQNEKILVPAEIKIAWINLLSQCGFSAVEVTSFVSPKWVPQMADHQEVYQAIQKYPGVRYPVLVPNVKGLEAALAVGVKDIALFIAASETFSQKNINCSIEESFERLKLVVDLAKQYELNIRGYVSCVVNCPYEGKIAPQKVAEVSKRLFDLGCYEISLGDTTGKALPEEVRTMLQVVTKVIPTEKLAGHFHDTAGHALENITVAFDEFKITTFDSSLAGLGGCPYAPGAKGNVATENVVRFFEERGISTGIHQEALMNARQFIQHALLNRDKR